MALYNGIEFPNLPEYDKEIYPYAYIVQQTLLGSSYILFLSKTPFYAKAWSSTKYIIDSNGVDTDALYHKIENGAWVNTSTWGVINHMYTPIWSNTDMFVLVEDKTAGTKTVTDTVYLKASSSIHMLLDLQSWLKGYVLGVSGMAFAKEPEPVAYLYNGLKLPKLPEWDKETYPYAVISYRAYTEFTRYYLSVYKENSYFYYSPNPNLITEKKYFGSQEEETALLFVCITGETEWTQWENTRWSIGVDKENMVKDDVLWTNFDLYYSDDTLYVGASEPVPVFEKTPVAYLYNGLKLPPLPEWDKEVYPYAFIMEYELNDMGAHFRTANLYLVPKVEYVEANNGNWCVSLGNGYKYSNILVGLDDAGASENDYVGKEWSTLENKEGMGIVVSEIDWANFNLLNKDGSVHLATSEPVPVYE